MSNFYETLNVHPKASFEEINRVYRQLALQYHPDKNLGDPSAHDTFAAISAANDVLSDPYKRAVYDDKLRGVHGKKKRKHPRDPVDPEDLEALRSRVMALQGTPARFMEVYSDLSFKLADGIPAHDNTIWDAFSGLLDYLRSLRHRVLALQPALKNAAERRGYFDELDAQVYKHEHEAEEFGELLEVLGVCLEKMRAGGVRGAHGDEVAAHKEAMRKARRDFRVALMRWKTDK